MRMEAIEQKSTLSSFQYILFAIMFYLPLVYSFYLHVQKQFRNLSPFFFITTLNSEHAMSARPSASHQLRTLPAVASC
jgi:hypothetical protein